MSFDLNVLVCREQFPTDAWQALLSEVGETTDRASKDLPGCDRVFYFHTVVVIRHDRK